MPVETRISFSDGSTSDSVRKLSDELSRKHLSAASSTHSGTSMDALWEKHPRRLSEAGLRRHSDHSVVLTEDTDSFIIGERVWVGGSKPGQIAYIGETQFAPGEWAGIVLDDAIGKNDGSVAGFHYFQCSEKKGVFSRLTRLTRAPLFTHSAHDASPVSDAGSVFERPPSGIGRPRRALSPNGSIRSAVSSKMNASISTTSPEVRLGERVIVSSSRGSKAGTLRYAGAADFAPGLWAGVELDDPLGKNDGSVDGKRYFECAPRFGLFAPLAKVSRSPSSRKPGACAVHSSGRGTPLRRSSSRDSLGSLATVASASSRPQVPRAHSAPPRRRAVRGAPPPHRSAPSLLDKTLLVKHVEYDRCAIIALSKPRVYYDLSAPTHGNRSMNLSRWASETLPKSWRCSESVLSVSSDRSRRSLSSGSSRGSREGGGGGTDAVRWGGPRVGALRAPGGADVLLRLPPPRNRFSGFGKSYHYSCVSPFEFTYPYVVYI